jgi:thiaminase/transcriptional activator TenA
MGNRPDDPIYAEWIGMFGNDEYDALVGRTTALLDAFVGSPDDRRLAALSEIFDRSTRYESEFWDMAYGDPSAGSSEVGAREAAKRREGA